MNTFSEKMAEDYIPQMAIVVYATKGADSYYLEKHKIVNGRMGAGSPLSKKCISDILRTIAQYDDDMDLGMHGAIPKSLLYINNSIGRTKLVWYNPPMERTLHFVPSLGIPSGKVVMPGILYAVENDKLNVYAFKGDEPKDILCQAPYMNVNSQGSVCLGNAKAKKPKDLSFDEAIRYWEDMFWKSEFSHIYGTNPINGNLAVIISDCIKNGKPFPVDVLIETDKRLKDLLK